MRLTDIFEDRNLIQDADQDFAVIPGYKAYAAGGSRTGFGDTDSSDTGRSDIANGSSNCSNTAHGGTDGITDRSETAHGGTDRSDTARCGNGRTGRLRINVLALGDVGSTLAMGLMLTGNDIVSVVGLCDINEASRRRFEFEFGQFSMPDDHYAFPDVRMVSPEDAFDCDVFVFCASAGVPQVNAENAHIDVRMVQLEKNLNLIKLYAGQAAAAGYTGEFFVVSDPVDPLCKGVLDAGIDRTRIQGFGLGVMNARAAYFAKKEEKFSSYLTEGRAYGPHGRGLVIADSIKNYKHEISMQLTEKTISANMKMRGMGFKPYIAPAISSGAISILENLRGNWNYSSAYFGTDLRNGGASGAFWGMRNRRTSAGLEIENPRLDDRLMERIRSSYNDLKKL